MLTDDNTSWAIKPLALIDLPFSAVMDTLLLPWDYFRADDDKTKDSHARTRAAEREDGWHPSHHGGYAGGIALTQNSCRQPSTSRI
ncbi:hypothetical protein E05_28560 [Plautia stali symbiont]|nr:hypothetical protein E05_28560 [Plautia stali symbiont]